MENITDGKQTRGTTNDTIFKDVFSEMIASSSPSSWKPQDKQTGETTNDPLTFTMDIYSQPGSASAPTGEAACTDGASGWVLPIGANSGDKKKDVPMEETSKPGDLPDAWPHPPASFMDGKCGITAVSNMLRLYGMEVAPQSIDLSQYRSVGPGLRADKFADNLKQISGRGFSSGSVEAGQDPLAVLRDNLKAGKPVAIQYMTGSTNAHWVVVTGITDTKNGPELTVQSWGRYYKMNWADVQDAWRRGYGGPYPYVVGNAPSPALKKPN